MRRRDFGSLRTRGTRPGYYARVTWRGVTVEKYAGITRELAKRNLAEIRVRLEGGADLENACAEVLAGVPASGLTFDAAAKLFLESRKGRVKASTLYSDTGRLRVLCGSPFASRYLADLKPIDFARWGEDRRKDVSGATINRDLCLVSALFRWAVKMGHAKENPVRRVEKYSERGRARETYLTEAEARALVKAADPVMMPFLAAALSTGARRGELLRLAWRDVDFGRREIIIRPENEKAGRGRVVPMTADLFDVLSALHAQRSVSAEAKEGDDPVFRQASGEGITAEVVKKGFARALKACAAITSEKREEIVLHSLRHSAASFMVAQGVPLLDVARILGHSTLAVTMRYAHFAPASGRAAVDALGKALALSSPEKAEAVAR